MNRVCVVGNLTRDPESRQVGDSDMASLRIAVERAGGRDEAGFFNVAVFGNQVAPCVQYLRKGSQVAIDGRLKWREWEQDGNRREAVEIVADRVMFVGKKADGETAPAEDDFPF